MRLLSAAFLSLAIACSAFGQTYTINTIAGGGLPANLSATSATLGYAPGVAIDSAGNVLISLAGYNMVVRIDAATGNLTPIAGTGTAGYSGDNGPATSAELNYPEGLAVDSSGNLYIADAGNAVIRKVSNGTITTFGGGGSLVKPSKANGGFLTNYGFSQGIAVDSAGNVYVADTYNSRVLKVSTGGIITTVAGLIGGGGYSGDGGPATSATVWRPGGIAVDAAGNIYIADSANNCVREISGGIITTVAGTGTPGYNGDNILASSAQLYYPSDVAVDSAGNLYIADSGNGLIREVTNGLIRSVANPILAGGIAVDSSGNVYITTGSKVLKASNGALTTVAGGGTVGGNGSASGAQLNSPKGVAVDSAGNVYIADTNNGLLRQVSNGTIATLNGQLTPSAVAMDAAGNLYIADGSVIRKITKAGVVTTVAGTGIYTYSYNGDNIPATSAQLASPSGVAVDSLGNLYIADTGNNRIRKVSGGLITTVAGTSAANVGGNNNVPATVAQLSYPQGVAVDSSGNIYIADSDVVEEVSNGIITVIAGGGIGNVGDGQAATLAQLISPSGIAVDSSGSLYLADSGGSRVRKITGGISNTIAGNGAAAFRGDGGPSSNAEVDYPYGVAVDPSGTVYIADGGNNRIRALTPSGSSCTYAVSPLSFTGVSSSGGSLAVNIQTASGCVWVLPNLPYWITASKVAAAGSGSVTLTVSASLGPARNVMFSVAGSPVLLTQQGTGAAPSVNSGGVLNGASFTAPLVPGSIASAFGNFMLSSPASYTQSPLPTSLSGLSLQINGATPAPLFYVSSGQANFQVPWELSGQTQTILAATLNGATNAAQAVSLAPFAPAIFAVNGQGSGQGAVLDTSYRLVDSSNPATAGSTYVSIYCTGLGAVTNQPVTGSPALGDPLSWTTTIPTVTIGGAPATVSFYGLAPGYAGLYQVNAQVPAMSAKGNAVPVTVSIGGAGSNAVTIAVR